MTIVDMARRLLAGLALVAPAVLSLSATQASAQPAPWPTRPVRVIVSYAPNSAIRTAVEGSDVRQKLVQMGSEVVLSAPEAFATYLRETAPIYREVVTASGARVD